MNNIDKNDIENNIQSQSQSLINSNNHTDDYEKIFYKNLSNHSKPLKIYSNYIIITTMNIITFLGLKMNDMKTLHSFLVILLANILSFCLTYKEIYNSRKY